MAPHIHNVAMKRWGYPGEYLLRPQEGMEIALDRRHQMLQTTKIQTCLRENDDSLCYVFLTESGDVCLWSDTYKVYKVVT